MTATDIEMLTYDAQRPCPKCGHNVISSRYILPREPQTYQQHKRRAYYESQGFPVDCEFMLRRCERCGYTWPEDCL